MQIKEHNDQISALLEKHGVFFAFSQEQFDKAKKPDTEYVRIGSGAICPKVNVAAFNTEMDTLIEAQKQDTLSRYSKYDIIKYELANHECYYTGDIEEAEDALSDFGFTRDEIMEVYRAERNNQDL